jgi:hypothetical protein
MEFLCQNRIEYNTEENYYSLTNILFCIYTTFWQKVYKLLGNRLKEYVRNVVLKRRIQSQFDSFERSHFKKDILHKLSSRNVFPHLKWPLNIRPFEQGSPPRETERRMIPHYRASILCHLYIFSRLNFQDIIICIMIPKQLAFTVIYNGQILTISKMTSHIVKFLFSKSQTDKSAC